jgi:hypothetical protein
MGSPTFRVAVEYHPESGAGRMSRQDRISHHVDRAFEELDRARSATSPEAAIAHLALSELHLGRMKALSAAVDPPVLRIVE